MPKHGGTRRGRASIRFLKIALADVWREPVWASNDLLATVVRLSAMLDREENQTGRIYLTPAAIRALTGSGKVDRAWRILEQLDAIGIVELDRIRRAPPGSDRVDLARSGRSSSRSAKDRGDSASILVPKWPELQGTGQRLDRQIEGGRPKAPPLSVAPRLVEPPRDLDRPAMARARDEALDAIARAAIRFQAPTRGAN